MNRATAIKRGAEFGAKHAIEGGRISDAAKSLGLSRTRDTVTYPAFERAYDMAWQKAFFSQPEIQEVLNATR